ncbi:MAG: hypothetical protein RI957_1834, partial [Verrucomicrobiota bacterium]
MFDSGKYRSQICSRTVDLTD